MNDFATELRELIDKWRERSDVDVIEDIVIPLAEMIEELDPDDD